MQASNQGTAEQKGKPPHLQAGQVRHLQGVADGGEVLAEMPEVNKGGDVRQRGARQGQGAPRVDGESDK